MARNTGRQTVVVKPRSDAYTGMLAISLGALITGSVLLYIDYDQHEGKPVIPPAVKVRDPNAEKEPPPTTPAEKAPEGGAAPPAGDAKDK